MMSLLCASAGLLTLAASSLPVDNLQLPEGFSISVYADNVENARQMALSENGVLFVGSRKAGKVYALVDTNGDGRIDNKVDKKYTIASGLNMPSGIAYKDGSLYVAAISKVLRYDDIESKLKSPPKPVVVTNTLPADKYHGWKYLGFGPDGNLYVPVGVPCNVCITHDKRHGSILRLDVKTGKAEIYANGIRNSVGFDWHPETKELWFTENGRDWMGDNNPPDELNRAYRKGLNFGFPYIHGNNIYDPEYEISEGLWDDPKRFLKPEWELNAHVAPLGMAFYTGEQFPAEYKNQIFIAQHGSWNRSEKTGYRLVVATLGKYKVESVEPFVTGWLQKGDDIEDDGMHWGRPVDVINMPDGSILVSDDYADAIYRVTYSGKKAVR
jgi:glucose/arabinose dehydrogenase